MKTLDGDLAMRLPGLALGHEHSLPDERFENVQVFAFGIVEPIVQQHALDVSGMRDEQASTEDEVELDDVAAFVCCLDEEVKGVATQVRKHPETRIAIGPRDFPRHALCVGKGKVRFCYGH